MIYRVDFHFFTKLAAIMEFNLCFKPTSRNCLFKKFTEKLQYTDMAEEERLEIKKSLFKYCELDTLAMVMIYEYFRATCKN